MAGRGEQEESLTEAVAAGERADAERAGAERADAAAIGSTSLDETLAADSTAPASTPRPARPARSSSAPPPLDREGRRRLIESPERDQADLAPVDPEHYVHGYELARGGMGRIVAARDRRLGRVVAIKELIQHTPERAARFEREALITARLQHPAIVNLHEAGRWPSGQPFYAMKLVAGRSLAQVASEVRPLTEKLSLLPNLIAMVEAVAYAHRQRIIHRDLKPSNVLIGELGETVVIDWGLAKDLAAEPGDRTHVPPIATADTIEVAPKPPRDGDGGVHTGSLTVAGSVMGTPGYMPPEQAAGKDVDERADVYALGAILYHLLSGVEPYRGASADAILAAVLAGPPEPLGRVEPRLAHDLVTIVDKAMARDEAARYPTAVQLAEDLRRFQTGQLVAAHRYSRRQLVWRFLVRHRAAVTAVVAALIATAAIAWVSFRRVIAERDRAEAAGVAAARRADELAVAQAGLLLAEDPRAALALLSGLSPEASPGTWRTARMVASDIRMNGVPAVLRGHTGPVIGFDMSPRGDVVVSADLHEVRAWDPASGRGRLLGRQESVIQRLAVSSDGKLAATAHLDNRIRVWSLEGGAMTELGGHDGLISRMRFLPDSGRLLSAGADGAIHLWRVGGAVELVGRHRGVVFDLDVAAGGEIVATVGDDGLIKVWRLGQRDPVRELRPTVKGLTRISLSPDGARVAASGASRHVWVWQVDSGQGRELRGHDKSVWEIDFSADGRRLASGGEDRTIRLWDVTTGESEVLRDHTDEIDALRFALGSDVLVSAAADGTARVWMVDERSASPVQVLRGHDRDPGLDVSDDGRVVVTGAGSLLRRWEIGAASRSLRGHRGQVSQVAFAGDSVVSAGGDWSVRIWPLGKGEPRVMRGHESGIISLDVSSSGRWAASIDNHRFVRLWDLERGTGRALAGRAFGALRFSPDGAVLAGIGVDHTILLWSTATGEARLLRGHEGWVTALAFSPDGRALASAGADRAVWLWDFATGKGRALTGHQTVVRFVEFAGAGRVVSSDLGGVVREWDVASGQSRELGRGPTGVIALASSRDGQLIAWADGEGAVHLWSRATGGSRRLTSRDKSTEQLEFSPDGRTLVGRDLASRVLLWDTATGALLVLPTHGRTIADFAISPDGRHIATADSDRTVRLWPYDLPYDPTAMRTWLRRAAR